MFGNENDKKNVVTYGNENQTFDMLLKTCWKRCENDKKTFHVDTMMSPLENDKKTNTKTIKKRTDENEKKNALTVFV